MRCRFFGASRGEPPGTPLGLYHGTVGGLVAPTSTQMYCAMTDRHCMLCLRHDTGPRQRGYDWKGGTINQAASPVALLSPRHWYLLQFHLQGHVLKTITGKNQCILHFVKIVELLWKPMISTVFPYCGIVFFHSNSTHSISYGDQSVEILWKFSAYLQSVEKSGISWKFCGVKIVESVSSFVSVEKLWKFCGTN